jgi:two-component system cell cycle sensor histidine kinase/response regulator CckA
MSSTRTVLVVDDDALTRQLLESLLEMEGDYRLMFAHDGSEALELAASTPPDVILLDIVMPGIDGFEVCRQLRANPSLRQVPIILLTGLEGRASRLRGLEAGADEFLNKPVDLVELRTRIRTITQLNRFRQLSDERARFETAVNHSPDGIVLTDGAGMILHANQAFTKLVGPTPPRVLEVFPSVTAVGLKAQLAMLDRVGGQIDTFDTALEISAQPASFAEVTVVRLPWSEGTMLEFIFRDITDRKQLEAQLLRLQRIELLGQLASGVVHDVNNLLTAIRGHAEMLQEGTGKLPDDADAIVRTTDRGGNLLRRVLMFARGADQDLAPVEVTPILHDAAAIAGKLLGRNITLQVQAAPNLPQILGDASQVHQVVMNLCVNARDAMPGGGNLLLNAQEIELSATAARAISPDGVAGEFVAISVRDTGVGIPDENRGRLFDPFFTTKPRETATGLGLATVLRVMRRHHGFIGFESAVGDGSCFTCYFPALPASK